MESVISVEPFRLDTGNDATLASLVECYRDVFADPPWNEWVKCAVEKCGASWGKPDAAHLAATRYLHCEIPVLDYWSRDQVVADLARELEHGICWLAVERSQDAERVVGFTWGSPLGSRWDEFEPELRESLQVEFGSGVASDPTIVYQTEVGVLRTHRNAGLARRLAAARHRDFLDHGYRVGVAGVREMPEPSVTFLWYTRLGYRVVHRFPPENGRVVLARKLESGLFDHS